MRERREGETCSHVTGPGNEPPCKPASPEEQSIGCGEKRPGRGLIPLPGDCKDCTTASTAVLSSGHHALGF